MAQGHQFDQLIGALANSVVEAEFIIRRNQIQFVKKFFDANNQPICVDLKVQSVKPDAKLGDFEQLRVPLMTLVPYSQLSIAEMQVELNVEIGALSAAQGPPEDTYSFSVGEEQPLEFGLGWKNPSHEGDSPKIAVSSEGGASTDSESVNRAKVTLIVRSGEAPEGLSRLLSQLNRTI